MPTNTLSGQALIQIPISEIVPSTYQPRQNFDMQELSALAESIETYGVLQPLVVRPTPCGYHLVAGERRLRAAAMARLSSVPCIIYEKSKEDCAVATMVENLQRQNLSYWEEAYGYKTLIEQFGLTQDQLAARVGKSQASIANKLRLLKLPVQVQAILTSHNLTERHARALLRLPDTATIYKTVQVIIEKHLNVIQTDEYIDKLLNRKPAPIRTAIIRDHRLCKNTLDKAIRLIKKAGIKARAVTNEGDDYIEYIIRIPKH